MSLSSLAVDLCWGSCTSELDWEKNEMIKNRFKYSTALFSNKSKDFLFDYKKETDPVPKNFLKIKKKSTHCKKKSNFFRLK